jgi:hypothetical protein
MKINGKQELLAQITRRSLVLVGLLAMGLICATPGRAQSSAVTASAQDAKPMAAAAAPLIPAQTPAATASPAAVAATSTVSPEEKRAANGAKDGIVVHGHWTIVVKNPDGSIAARQEFENALDPIEGADLLTGLLSGEYSTAGFLIDLNSASGTICGFTDCVMYDSRTPSFCAGIPNCPSLTYTAKTGTANNNAIGFTLSGSATLATTDGGTINLVGAGISGCVPLSSTLNAPRLLPGTTPITYVSNAAAVTSFTTTLSGTPSSVVACNSNASTHYLNLLLTSRAITQPVTGGQSVAVTVVITFS